MQKMQKLPTALEAYRAENAALLRRMRREAARIDANIADMTTTLLRYVDAHGGAENEQSWQDAFAVRLDADIARFIRQRDELLALAGMAGDA